MHYFLLKNVKRCAFFLVFRVVSAFFASPAQAADGVREIKTEERVGLENGLVRIDFERRSGELVSLKNLDTDDEYLKETGGDGNPFRAYVDTTELPSALTHPWPELNPPVEGALGGKLIDGRNCVLSNFSFERDGEAEVLNLEMEHSATRLLFKLNGDFA